MKEKGSILGLVTTTAIAISIAMATVLGETKSLLVAAGSDCPLDLSWSNYSVAASACSDPNKRGICCRHISVFVAISVARYANLTGKLGVPTAFSDMCVDYVSDRLNLHGIPSEAAVYCGLGTKILVSYQCNGRRTILEMLQSPLFSDVLHNCKTTFDGDDGCKRCLNSAILYLHRLVDVDDNVTLSVCRDATFVSLINQVDRVSASEKASCFFGVGHDIIPDISGTHSSPTFDTSPSPISSEPSAQNSTVVPVKKHNHPYRFTSVQGVGIGVTGVAVLLLVILIPLILKKNRELKDATVPTGTSWKALPPSSHKCQGDIRHTGPESMFRRFSYVEMKKATNNFSFVIGRGGFGTVYKAQFNDGFMASVKQMDKVSEQAEDDFSREMELLSRLHHRNLVSLKGFCVEKHERFLVYEYMENGSLKDHLHSPGWMPLSWHTRMQIAVDVANALEYLHFFCDPPLCHRDIKSANILLDGNFTAKLADFGLAQASRSGSVSFELMNTDIRGTPGYMDPEYLVTHVLAEKGDIYSYGVLLLELVTGKCVIHDNKNLLERSERFLVTERRYHEMVDPLIVDSFALEQLQVMVEIVKWCTLRDGRARPSIKQVLRMLNERLNNENSDLPERMGENIQSSFGISRIKKDKHHLSLILPYNGDGRCHMSSSSTSKSYCSQSFLNESGSMQSPPS